MWTIEIMKEEKALEPYTFPAEDAERAVEAYEQFLVYFRKDERYNLQLFFNDSLIREKIDENEDD
jgi:hypothetical protein